MKGTLLQRYTYSVHKTSISSDMGDQGVFEPFGKSQNRVTLGVKIFPGGRYSSNLCERHMRLPYKVTMPSLREIGWELGAGDWTMKKRREKPHFLVKISIFGFLPQLNGRVEFPIFLHVSMYGRSKHACKFRTAQ